MKQKKMININVKTKQREYTFNDVKGWEVDGLFLLVESKNGEKRFIKTDDIENFLVTETEESEEE